ncbi:SGNH/GDSL hydrolase family protein [Methylomicrobium lacus]|uniref:SGNH/GDSL hydrolase family protein n=1 Tax=Methylomicrobium lacus TaxID=136992 RepID=UPI00045EAED4|nr:SGNH/GDSL hydrolase family protein [Methylomicrobium lacus]
MKNPSIRIWTRFILAILVFGLPGMASAQLTFSGIVTFGTSVSDPGNAFSLLAHPVSGLNLEGDVSQNTPPYDTLDESLVPSAPYAKGGHHFSNGATWIEQFAQGRGLAADVGPAFQSDSSKAHNYAVGGARATNYPDRVNLPQQVQAFLDDVGQTAPADALYVIEFGNNDIRDALVEFFTVFLATGDQTQAVAAANAVITAALSGIADNIQVLYGSGARKFLVLNAARIDLLPAVTALGPDATTVAGILTDGFNQGLAQNVLASLSALPGIQIAQLDIADQMATIIGSPSDYGLTNVTDPCVTPDTPPYTCKKPDSFFFWDGIHPTKAVHAIINQEAVNVLANYP